MATTSAPISTAAAAPLTGNLPAAGGTHHRAGHQQADQISLSIVAGIPWKEMAVPIAVLAVVLAMIAPVPAFLLDGLIALNIAFSVVVLLVGIYVARPVDFSLFPTTLLLLTLFRLALNISSSRLILLNGNTGTSAAGHVIEAFGNFVVGGNYIIGTVIFLVLIAIQYVVINHGAVRISEVTARFTLDALPGKQMSIDSDLNAGLIDESEARSRRKQLAAEAEFYGAMDGAGKFVKGDAIAGLVIVGINVIGGMLIGILQHKIPAAQAASTYTLMTVGDGLVSQIPALIISIAAGLLVSKAGVEGAADKALVTQLAMNPVSLGMVSATSGVLAFIPGMPVIPFLIVAVAAGALAWRRSHAPEEVAPLADLDVAPAEQEEEPIAASLAIDEIKIELGYGLLALINDLDGRKLTDQIRALRKTLAADYGFVMPPVRILDNMRLPTQGYAIRIKEMECGAGEVRIGGLMAMDPRGGQVELPGDHVREPAFGLPATWIDDGLKEEATFRGYTIVDPATVLTTHLTEILKDNMADLLSYAEVQKLIKDLAPDQKKLADDVIPAIVTGTTFQRVLQALLRERVSIRDLQAILEGVAEAAPHTTSITSLVESVRAKLGRQLCWAHRGDDGALPIVTLSPDWEVAFSESLVGAGEDKQLAMAPSKLQEFIRGVREAFERAALAGDAPVLLTSPLARPYVRQIIERFRGQTVVMSQNEIHPKARLRTVGQV